MKDASAGQQTSPISLKSKQKMRVLVVRPDRIGDVVLSTPVFEVLKSHNPEAEVHALVKDVVVPVVEHNPFLSRTLSYEPQGRHKGFAGFWRLVSDLRAFQYDVCVTLQVQWKVAFAVLFARIKVRLGPYSKWYSYLCFNKGMRQRRSLVEMHEADYNLMLLRRLGIRAGTRRFLPHIIVDADAKERMRSFLKEQDLLDQKFVIIHPGMGGSALNWPRGYYVDLVALLALRGINVLLTGAAPEKQLVESVYSEVKQRIESKDIDAKVRLFIGSLSQSGLADFIALQSLSSLVVAPSTGPLHIATALGKPTVSFFSPIRVQSALRWGPYVNNESRHEVLVPDALCGQDFKCAGKKCYFYFCMERLSVDEAVHAVIEKLEKS